MAFELLGGTHMLLFGNTILDNAQHEVSEHGTADFPIACYFDDLTQIDTPWHWHDEIEIGTVLSSSLPPTTNLPPMKETVSLSTVGSCIP